MNDYDDNEYDDEDEDDMDMDMEGYAEDYEECDFDEDTKDLWDGFWGYGGLCSMMEHLDGPNFVESQQEAFLLEKGRNPFLKEEFIALGFYQHNCAAHRVNLNEAMSVQKLHMADGLVRRLEQGMILPRIRICRLDEELELKPLIDLKQRGDEKLVEEKYEDAIDLYTKALLIVENKDLYVAPRDQIEQIVAVLASIAECEFRLGNYSEAGVASTDALVFMKDHGKSRICRARSGLELAKHERDGTDLEKCVEVLMQAQKDLECTFAAQETWGCRNLKPEITMELSRAQNGLMYGQAY